MKHRIKHFAYTILPPLAATIVLLIVWEGAGRTFTVKDYLLPIPTRVMSAGLRHAPALLRDSTLTFIEAVMALGIAAILAFFAAVTFQMSAWLRRAFLPIVVASKAVPIIVFAPLFALWFGYGPNGKVALGVVVAFLPIVVNATFGMDAVTTEQLDLFRLHNASKWRTLWKLRLPTAVPFIVPALRLSATLAVLGVVIAEMTGASAGLGATIFVTSATYDTALLFAAALCSLMVCIALLGVIGAIEALALRRFRQDLSPIQHEV